MTMIAAFDELAVLDAEPRTSLHEDAANSSRRRRHSLARSPTPRDARSSSSGCRNVGASGRRR